LGKGRGLSIIIKSQNYDYKVQESPPNIMVTRKPMVCESLSKQLVVQGKDASPQCTLPKVSCIVVWLFY